MLATLKTDRRPSRSRVERSSAVALGAVLVAVSALPAFAERIQNQVAVFSALDKVTARISKFEVELNKSVEFGSIKVTPRVCYSRPATELPKTTTFVEVDENQLDGTQKRIFTGWMFAPSARLPSSLPHSAPPPRRRLLMLRTRPQRPRAAIAGRRQKSPPRFPAAACAARALPTHIEAIRNYAGSWRTLRA